VRKESVEHGRPLNTNLVRVWHVAYTAPPLVAQLNGDISANLRYRANVAGSFQCALGYPGVGSYQAGTGHGTTSQRAWVKDTWHPQGMTRWKIESEMSPSTIRDEEVAIRLVGVCLVKGAIRVVTEST